MKNANTSVTTMTVEQFKVVVGQVKRIGKIANAIIQRAAVYAVYQSIEHRNSSPADALFQALPAGMSKRSLAAFFEANGNLAYMKESKKIAFFDVAEFTKLPGPVFDEDTLMGDWWHKYAPPAPPTSAWDAISEFDKLIVRMEKAVKDETREVEHVELIGKMKAVLAKYVRESA